MKRSCISGLTVLGLIFGAVAMAATPSATPTFSKEVARILQAKCQDCHRPGEAAPMSLITYQEARPWAKSIRQAVLTKKMPPWFADPHYGKFANDRSLSQAEIDTLVAWVDAGAPEGNPQDVPAPRKFVEGWAHGKPDLVLEVPTAFSVPSTGVVPYQWVIVPTHLTEDKWVMSTEVRPGDRSVIHHVISTVREPSDQWMRDKKPGEYFTAPGKTGDADRSGRFTGGFATYVPGWVDRPPDPHYATFLKAGSDIVVELQYTPNGKATSDTTKIGLIFSSVPPTMKYVGAGASKFQFVIPAGESNYKIEASSILQVDGDLVSIYPHAHLRGKAWEYRAIFPNGEKQTLLKVPDYDFNWQLTYFLKDPIHLPKGTRIEVTAWYDNSANNPRNPDPTKEVQWGEQSWEEMMVGNATVVVDAGMKIGKRASQPSGGGGQ